MNSLAAALFLGLTGAVGGSFASTAALRTAAGEQVLRGRSRCDSCRRQLTWVETVPLFSYAAGGGRCLGCRARISVIHPVGELAGAAAAAVLGIATPAPVAFAMTLMAATLLAASVIDARTQRLPNPLTVVVAVCAAFLAFRAGLVHVAAGAIAAATATAVLLLLRRAFSRARGDPALGLGDVKLIAAFAIWLGPNTAVMVAAAAVLALAVVALRGAKTERIAFGPMIALAGWSIGVAGELGLWPS